MRRLLTFASTAQLLDFIIFLISPFMQAENFPVRTAAETPKSNNSKKLKQGWAGLTGFMNSFIILNILSILVKSP